MFSFRYKIGVFGTMAVLMGARLPALEAFQMPPVGAGEVVASEVTAAITRAEKWLLDCQTRPGVFKPRERNDVSRVLLHSMVLWALSSDEPVSRDRRDTILGCRDTLLRYRQKDGGIYNPQAELARYESAAALTALQLVPKEHRSEQLVAITAALKDYLDSVETEIRDEDQERDSQLSELGEHKGRLDKNRRKALEFLQGTRFPEKEPIIDDQNAPMVFSNLSQRPKLVDRLIRANSDPSTLRLPESIYMQLLESRIQPGSPGRCFQLLVMTRILVNESGVRSNLARIMVARAAGELLKRQRADGSWDIERPSWHDEPILETCSAIIVLREYLRLHQENRSKHSRKDPDN